MPVSPGEEKKRSVGGVLTGRVDLVGSEWGPERIGPEFPTWRPSPAPQNQEKNQIYV